jgi:hypothetical protein
MMPEILPLMCYIQSHPNAHSSCYRPNTLVLLGSSSGRSWSSSRRSLLLTGASTSSFITTGRVGSSRSAVQPSSSSTPRSSNTSRSTSSSTTELRIDFRRIGRNDRDGGISDFLPISFYLINFTSVSLPPRDP